ncbi:MAG: hypothetical protein HKN18_01505 [Silicimonas sp.]|nr:hypothetical protein [Silicimonas sp.]
MFFILIPTNLAAGGAYVTYLWWLALIKAIGLGFGSYSYALWCRGDRHVT